MKRILFVCMGNICRSPTAEGVMRRLVRQEGIDVVVTTSPPGSVHLVGAAVKRATGVRWVADLRDSLVAHPHRDAQRLLVRAKEQGHQLVAKLAAQRADAIVCVSDAIAEEMRALGPKGRVATIANVDDPASHPAATIATMTAIVQVTSFRRKYAAASETTIAAISGTNGVIGEAPRRWRRRARPASTGIARRAS